MWAPGHAPGPPWKRTVQTRCVWWWWWRVWAILESTHSPGFWCGCPLLLPQHCCAGLCRAVYQSSTYLCCTSSCAKHDLVVICLVVKVFISLCKMTCESSYRWIDSHKRLYRKNLKTFSRCSACPLYHASTVTTCAEFEPASFMQASLRQNLKTTVSFIFTLKNPVLGEKIFFKTVTSLSFRGICLREIKS